MKTSHRVVAGDARNLSSLDDESVELVVTSPPYPMIEMWDDLFTDLNPAVEEDLANGAGRAAFTEMHRVLDEAWAEVKRVLVDGGLACINIGDATRKVDDSFRVYQNHSAVTESFESLGFEPLPEILWRKPTNSGAKFMGSGMLPPNAYVTLEHEYILSFRKGKDGRSFEPNADRRYRASYFWEERNKWFSDLWDDVNGTRQATADDDLRERSAAYPFEIPYRLINMYSVYGDTVLDPFWGTGTTTTAAMVAGRNSVGVEIDPAFIANYSETCEKVAAVSEEVTEQRLQNHRRFVNEKEAVDGSLKYDAANYDFPVTTKQERPIRLYQVSGVAPSPEGFEATHVPV